MKENTHFKINLIIYSLFFLLFINGTLTFEDYGIGIDDKFHRLNGFYWLDYLLSFTNLIEIQELVKLKLSQITDQTLPSINEFNKYSIIFDVPAAILELILGLDNEKDFYELRHYLNFIFYFVGCVYFYKLLSLRFNKLISLIGCAFFVLSPRIYGESFYNMKDIIFLTFLTMSYFYCFKYFLFSKKMDLIILAILSAICIQVRIIGLALPLSFIFFYFLSILSKPNHLKNFFNYFIFLILTILFLYCFWPYLWSSPLKNFFSIFYNWVPSIHILFKGNYILNDYLPFSYLPLWILISTPTIHIIFFIFGFFHISKRFFIRLINVEKNKLSYDFWRGIKEKNDLFLFLNFVVLMILIIFLNVRLFNSWKHLYFVNFYIIYITTFGLNSLFIFFKKKKFIKIYLSIIFLCLSFTTFKMYKYHPYQGLYFNSLVSDNFKNKFEIDFTALSARHFFNKIFDKNTKDKVYIGTASWTPLNRTLDVFAKKEKNKIVFVGQDYQKAEYIFTNNISEVDKTLNDKYDIPKNFSKYYDYKIEGLILYSVYKKN